MHTLQLFPAAMKAGIGRLNWQPDAVVWYLLINIVRV
jgi:hypothetical protein